MPASTTLRPHRSRSRARRAPLVAVAAIAALAAAVPLWFAFRPATTVDLEVANPTDRRIHVTVRSADEHSVIALGSVGPDSSYRFHEVLDQGDDWVITFDAGGVAGGEVEASATELEDAGWSVEIPDRIGDTLADAGIPASP